MMDPDPILRSSLGDLTESGPELPLTPLSLGLRRLCRRGLRLLPIKAIEGGRIGHARGKFLRCNFPAQSLYQLSRSGLALY
jgi:hypothetical protein